MVSMNGTASVLTTKSPYVVRTSFTLPQVAQALGTWAATKGGIKKAYTMVTDFGPGIDAEQYFQRGFKESGGEIIGSVRTPPGQPGFFSVRPAHQGCEPGIDFRIRPRRSAACCAREGVRGPRN